ncbi:MAG: zinc ABC transporter solute-binding protein [Gammaproteobacteria bacterium]|nr:zinc ABC transporter solute-binding protein [Gammaproteobacteria bacterium]
MRPLSFLFTVFFILSPWSDASARLLVSVTVPAQAWLVNQLAGDLVDLLTMIPEGRVPRSAQPSPRKLARSQQADIQFIVGHPALFFEARYITPYRKPDSKAVWISMFDVAKQMQPPRILKATDPHLWTSALIMMATARVVADSLARLDPENAERYQKNWLMLNTAVKKLDKQIREKVAQSQFRELLVYHPAWGHFSQDYGLRQLAIEAEGKAPSLGSLSSLFRTSEKNDINFIISSPGADQRLAGIIAAQLKIEVLVVDPMDPDWMHMMRRIKTAVEKLK